MVAGAGIGFFAVLSKPGAGIVSCCGALFSGCELFEEKDFIIDAAVKTIPVTHTTRIILFRGYFMVL
jgi:hypothetical protein